MIYELYVLAATVSYGILFQAKERCHVNKFERHCLSLVQGANFISVRRISCCLLPTSTKCFMSNQKENNRYMKHTTQIDF